jgi:hypothetical protein
VVRKKKPAGGGAAAGAEGEEAPTAVDRRQDAHDKTQDEKINRLEKMLADAQRKIARAAGDPSIPGFDEWQSKAAALQERVNAQQKE